MTEEKKPALALQIQQLIDQTHQDVSSFYKRFKGYAQDKDLQLLQTRDADLDIFAASLDLFHIKERLQQIIEKMELLESNYMKQINTEIEKPLNEFNKELHMIFNENRIDRNYGLNQLSGAGRFAGVMYVVRSRIRFFYEMMQNELSAFFTNLFSIFAEIFSIIASSLMLGLSFLTIINIFIVTDISFPFVELGFLGLVAVFCRYALIKKNIFSGILCMTVLVIGYIAYEFVMVNFGL